MRAILINSLQDVVDVCNKNMMVNVRRIKKLDTRITNVAIGGLVMLGFTQLQVKALEHKLRETNRQLKELKESREEE